MKQLAIANKSIGGGVIVVLAERDKEEMEMDIAKLEFDLMGTSVICRSGSPLILADLKKVAFSILTISHIYSPLSYQDIEMYFKGFFSYKNQIFWSSQIPTERFNFFFHPIPCVGPAGLSLQGTGNRCIGI